MPSLTAERKPLQKVDAPQSREPKSIRFEPSLWERIACAARHRGTEPSALTRELAVIGLTVLEHPEVGEAYMRAVTALHAQPAVVGA